MTIRPLLIVLIALALPAAACDNGRQAASSSGHMSTASPSASVPKGVVSVAEAKSILARWEEAEQQAGRQGGKDWTAAESGLAAQMSRAQSQVLIMIGESVDTTRKTIIKPHFAIPPQSAGAPWFMAEYARKGNSTWHQVVFRKTSAGWRSVAESHTTSKSRPPAAARDNNGLATVVAPDDRDGLIASPRQIARAHARLQNTFGQDERARKLFTSGACAVQNAAGALGDRKAIESQWTMTVRAQPTPEIYALRTSTGGALVWYGIRQQDTMVAHSNATSTMSFTVRAIAALSHGRRYSRKAVLKGAGIYLAVVPRSPNRVRIPAEWFIQLTVTGS